MCNPSFLGRDFTPTERPKKKFPTCLLPTQAAHTSVPFVSSLGGVDSNQNLQASKAEEPMNQSTHAHQHTQTNSMYHHVMDDPTMLRAYKMDSWFVLFFSPVVVLDPFKVLSRF